MLLGRYKLQRREEGNTEARKEDGGLRDQLEEYEHPGLKEQVEEDEYPGLKEQVEEDEYPGESGTLLNLKIRF